MDIELNLIKLLRELAPMTINVCLKIKFSRWQRFRFWLGLKMVVLGCRLTGMPIEINVQQENTDEPN